MPSSSSDAGVTAGVVLGLVIVLGVGNRSRLVKQSAKQMVSVVIVVTCRCCRRYRFLVLRRACFVTIVDFRFIEFSLVFLFFSCFVNAVFFCPFSLS